MRPAKSQRKELTPAPQVAARAVIQILMATGKRYTVDGLREKLRELLRMEGNSEIRAVASMSSVELIAALLDANTGLEKFGIRIGISNGQVSLGTTEVEPMALRTYIASLQPVDAGSGDLSQAAMEVLGCIALKQPIAQIEIDHIFNADKRGVVGRLREAGLVEEFASEGGRLMFATTERFLRRFDLKDLSE
ncbi:MAG: SMC-Scp complex subunit ScpB, partial [Akkermansiaceae bacterium]|nr:SMC-Scp complex subunit ScpB [Akkermansiaceae bacterium]